MILCDKISDFADSYSIIQFLNLMSPPLLGIEGQGQVNASSVTTSSSSANCVNVVTALEERNYLGLSDCSSVDSSSVSTLPEENKNSLNLKATELRLGLPGSQSPERVSMLSSVNLDEKQLFPLIPSKDGICSGNKRGFADTSKTEVAKSSQECNNKINSPNASSAPAAK